MEHVEVAYVDDEGIPGWALLGVEDLCDGGGIEGVGSEAVYGFGREGYRASGAQDLSGLGYVVRGWR